MYTISIPYLIIIPARTGNGRSATTNFAVSAASLRHFFSNLSLESMVPVGPCKFYSLLGLFLKRKKQLKNEEVLVQKIWFLVFASKSQLENLLIVGSLTWLCCFLASETSTWYHIVGKRIKNTTHRLPWNNCLSWIECCLFICSKLLKWHTHTHTHATVRLHLKKHCKTAATYLDSTSTLKNACKPRHHAASWLSWEWDSPNDPVRKHSFTAKWLVVQKSEFHNRFSR